jgi:hypothetical protein
MAAGGRWMIYAVTPEGWTIHIRNYRSREVMKAPGQDRLVLLASYPCACWGTSARGISYLAIGQGRVTLTKTN